jgi:hypothetical protein
LTISSVVQMILRISTSKARNGTKSAVRHEVARVKWMAKGGRLVSMV